MHQKVSDFLKTQRVSVLAVEMLDGSPHGATVHFANSDEPLLFYFETNKTYRKAEPLFEKTQTRATLVIGTTESNMRTLQVDGIVRLIKPEENDEYEKVYLGKFPEKNEKSKSNDYVRFLFIPSWWRYTDWTSEEKIVLTSE